MVLEACDDRMLPVFVEAQQAPGLEKLEDQALLPYRSKVPRVPGQGRNPQARGALIFPFKEETDMSALNFPEDRRYHAEHLWAKGGPADGSFVIGITDFAQEQLGEVIFIDLPEVGGAFSPKAFPAPRSSRPRSSPRPSSPSRGTVVEVNAALNDTPELVNSDPLRRRLAGARQAGRPVRSDHHRGPNTRRSSRPNLSARSPSRSLRRPAFRLARDQAE